MVRSAAGQGRGSGTEPGSDGNAQTPPSWVTAAPLLFVLLWSTGFLGAKFGLPYAEPATFLLLRFMLVTLLLVVVAVIVRAPWPRTWREVRHAAVVGVLIHGIYLGGIFAAIAQGVPAGLAALIAGLQPLLTAILAGPLLGEAVTARQWGGLTIGLLGVALVVWQQLGFAVADVAGIAFCLAAVLGITFGTLYQKRHGAAMDLRTGAATQFTAAGLFMLVPALLFETMTVRWSGEFLFALLWLVLVLSIGAISLLYVLIRHGAAAKVASLFYLVPPVTALFAFFLFGETLGALALLGMALAVAGVALVTRGG
ncbi:MAG: DMT family transporter [Rhodospirillales bacterium]|nr:MAG: DMT family transporter [Rhodospirillales bacterium]